MSCTVDLFLMLGVICAGMTIPDKVKHSLLAVCNMELSILGSALIFISIYSEMHSSYTNLPIWTNYIFTLIGLILIVFGIFGYYLSFKPKATYLYIYTGVLALAALFVLIAGIGFIVMSGFVIESLEGDWEQITEALRRDGYGVDKQEFG
jgi:hypothetical protein